MAKNHSGESSEDQNPRQINLPLDFSSIKSLPESHAWSEESKNNDETIIDNGAESSIPIIDLMDPNAMELIGHACESWGAFLLKNHGVPLSFMEELEAETKRLFDLPSEQKLRALRNVDNPTGYGTVWISPFFEKYMWQEGFTIVGSAVDNAKKIWPDDYKQFCDVMEEFENKMRALIEKLIHLIFKFLNLSDEEKNWIGSNNHATAIQLNSYPPCPEPDRAMGIAAHTDTSTFTVLHQSLSTGLQVYKEGSGWVTVPIDPNTLVVNTGDVLHILSNGRLTSALHRVVANKKQRYSMVCFYRPKMEIVVSPLVRDDGDDGSVAIYRSLTFKEYVGIKDKHFDKALSVIRI